MRQGLAFIKVLAEDVIEEDEVIDEEIGLSDEALDEVDPSDTDSFDDDLDAMDAEQEAPYREVPKSIVYAQLPKSPEDKGVGNTLGNEDAQSEYNGKHSAISQLSSQGHQAFYGLDNRGNIAWQMRHTPDATDSVIECSFVMMGYLHKPNPCHSPTYLRTNKRQIFKTV